MKKTIKVAIARPPSIKMVADIVSTEGKLRTIGNSDVDPAEFYIALTDGNKVIYEIPVSEDMSVDFLNKLLEHFGLL